MSKTHEAKEVLTDVEWGNILDWLCNQRLTKEGAANFASISRFLGSDALRVLSEHPRHWRPLSELYSAMTVATRLSFLAHCFQFHDSLSTEELAGLWYRSLYDNCLQGWYCANRNRLEFYDDDDEKADQIFAIPRVNSFEDVLFNPVLIDNTVVIQSFCQLRRPGWEFLRYIKGREYKHAELDSTLAEKLAEKNTAGFCLYWDMLGDREVTFELLADLVKAGAVEVFKELLLRLSPKRTHKICTDVSLYVVTQSPEPTATELLKVIEATHPGFLKRVRDHWGRNLLWYAMRNCRIPWFHPGCKIVSFLLEVGCNPENRNQVGLRWKDAVDWLTLPVKERMSQDIWHINYHYSA